MTEAEKAKIDDAMTVAQGSQAMAAEILGMARVTLNSRISNNADLKARWTKRRNGENHAPTEAEELGRKTEIPAQEETNGNQTSIDVALAEAIAIEDTKIRKGLAAMGLTEIEIEMAFALQQFDGAHFTRSIQIMGASATRTSIIISMQVDEIKKRLGFVRKQLEDLAGIQDEKRQAWVKEECSLVAALVAVADQARKMMEVGYKGALIRATIMAGRKPLKQAKTGFVVDAETVQRQ